MTPDIFTNNPFVPEEISTFKPTTDLKEFGSCIQPVRKCIRFSEGVVYDPNLRYLRTNGCDTNIPLTWVETIVFEKFLKQSGNSIVTYDQISTELYSENCNTREAVWVAITRLRAKLNRIPNFKNKLRIASRNVKYQAGYNFDVNALDKLIHPAPIVFEEEFSYDFSLRELKKKQPILGKVTAKRSINSPTISFIWETLITNPNKTITKEYWLNNLYCIRPMTYQVPECWWVLIAETRRLIKGFSPDVASRIITRNNIGLEYKTPNI